MHKLYLLLLSITAIFLFDSCRQNHLEPASQGGCDTTAISFSADIQSIISQHCTSCHNNDNAQGNVNLSGYSNVAEVANDGRLVKVVNHEPPYTPMPYLGEKLPPCNIQKISAWVNQGAQNN